MILLYHRVADLEHDPQLLAVSPKNFSEHMRILSDSHWIFPVSLEAKVNLIKGQHFIHHAIAVTFDDGYADNLHNALPRLEACLVPATFFITVGPIITEQRFYWDDSIEDCAILTPDELKELDLSVHTEIGSHTCNHRKLSALKQEGQDWELRSSKLWLEQTLGHPIKYLSYPFGSTGDFNQTTKVAAQCVGYTAAFANTQENVTTGDMYSIPRRIVRNWSGKEFEERLRIWLKN
jgi:peptidoglycan/xylan/chitin deacetylase (PgdA/CDA1 family)